MSHSIYIEYTLFKYYTITFAFSKALKKISDLFHKFAHISHLTSYKHGVEITFCEHVARFKGGPDQTN